MTAIQAKRLKVHNDGAVADQTAQFATLLDRLQSSLTTQPLAGDGLEAALADLLTLQNGSYCPTVVTEAALKTLNAVAQKLQAAVLALQSVVDSFTPPPGYKPPPAGDAAFVHGLLQYAHRLSYSSSAPMGYQPGQPLYLFKPPAPQEAEMRVSQLHAFNRDWEARQQALAAQQRATAAPAVAGEAPPAAAPAAKPAAAAPANADFASLAAQHGLDVRQLLASMPPGWKPGDPIPVGPAPDAPSPAAAAAKPAAPVALPASVQPKREVSPAEEERAAAPPAPLLTGIFLDDPTQYQYVSSDEEDDSSEDSD